MAELLVVSRSTANERVLRHLAVGLALLPLIAGCESVGWSLVQFEQNISRVAVAVNRETS